MDPTAESFDGPRNHARQKRLFVWSLFTPLPLRAPSRRMSPGSQAGGRGRASHRAADPPLSGHSAVQARGDGRGRGHRRVERDHVNYSSCVLLGQTSCGSSGQETPTATLPVGGLISLTCECGLLTKRRQALEARLTLAGQTRYLAERTL